MIVEFLLTFFANFVRGVAAAASHVEGGVAATFFRNVGSLGVTGQAEILFLIAGSRLQQLKLVVGSMRVVALDAVTHGRGMNCAFERRRVFVGVAGDAQRL